MKLLCTSGLFLLCLMVGMVSATAGTPAYVLNPAESIVQGAPVTITFAINYSERFTYTHDLRFSTQLDNPAWNYTVFLNGVPEPRPEEMRRNFSISGFELDYPTRKVSISGRLTGTAPSVTETTKTILFAADEFDTRNNIVVTSPYAVERDDMPNSSSPPSPDVPCLTPGAPSCSGQRTILDQVTGWFRSIFGMNQ